MEPIIDHIEITVKDMSVAVPFYDKLLPPLGFDVGSRGSAVIEEHEKHVVWYEHPRLGFTITSPRRAFVGTRSIAGSQGGYIILHSERHLAPRSTSSILRLCEIEVLLRTSERVACRAAY